MPIHRAERSLPFPAAAVYAWHARPCAFARLNAPWEPAQVLLHDHGLDVGVRIVFRGRIGPIPFTWEGVHTVHEADRGFTDAMVKGPFARWVHQHRFEPEPEGSRLIDEVDWALPLAPVTHPLGGWLVRRKLAALFAFRHARTADDLARHALYADRPRKTVLVAGATGFVGERLCAFLSTGGHTVRRLVRGAPKDEGEWRWDPDRGRFDAGALEGVDAVIQLAGSPISVRWTPEARQRILDSRLRSTGLLAEAIARAERPPELFLSTSAIGFYGDAGEALCPEDAPRGSGFAAEVCEQWEAATAPAQGRCRVAIARVGLPLDAAGGLLAGLLPTARLGLGGPVGSGRQWMPWIAVDDLLGALHHALWETALEGPFNACAPEPVRQADFARALGRALGRPGVLPAPGFALKAVFGQMAEELILGGQRAVPGKLAATGFVWREPELEACLRRTLGG